MLAELSRAASFIWLLVTLPGAVVFLSDRAALGIASSAALFHFLGGLSLPFVSTLTRAFGFLHFPIFAGLTSLAALFAPSFLMSPFAYLLDWLGPILLLVQGVQAVRLSIYLSNNAMDYIYSAPTLIRTIILSASVIMLGWAAYIYYAIYTHPALDVLTASITSSVAACSLCLLFASLFSPIAVPSDPAAAALIASLAVSHILPSLPRAGLASKALQLFMPGNWFTLALTLFTLPLSLTPDAFARATAEPVSEQRSSMVQACIVCMYARFVLSSVGRWGEVNAFWHMAEALVALGFYTGRLVAPLLAEQ